MCGIIGYVGKDKKALHVLINGLKNLEYRGYDSAGIALIFDNEIKVIKSVGKIKDLEEKLTDIDESNLGIGHTRWATHGNPVKENAHPHKVGQATIVHNGIIENYEEIKRNLRKKGYNFKSTTDSEVIAALIDYTYLKEKDKLETLREVEALLEGSYALGIIFNDDKETIYTIRQDSPLIIAKGQNENFIASDVPAILEFTNKYILLENGEIGVITKDNIIVYNNHLDKMKKEEQVYTEPKETAMKNGYEHFMLKEINDEPIVLEDCFNQFNSKTIKELIKNMPNFEKYHNVDIVACGSAYHAGLIGKNFLEEIGGIPTNVELASEYRYKENFSDKKTLTILISQSGETADTLAALRKAKKRGIDTLGIINTAKSSIAREANNTIYIKAGPEIAVATTKAYSAQSLILMLISIIIAKNNNNITIEEANKLLEEVKNIKETITKEIEKQEKVKKIAKTIYNEKDIFFIGRKIDYALCMEASLKLKEISYIHSESYPAGELKHGTISLIEKNTPVISIITDDKIESKTISNIKEVVARGAKIILITTEKIYNKYKDSDFYDQIIVIEKENNFLNPLKVATIIQLLAYEIANLKDVDIDKPRNLAKSVTVE